METQVRAKVIAFVHDPARGTGANVQPGTEVVVPMPPEGFGHGSFDVLGPEGAIEENARRLRAAAEARGIDAPCRCCGEVSRG
jgi:hypothetical protein